MKKKNEKDEEEKKEKVMRKHRARTAATVGGTAHEIIRAPWFSEKALIVTEKGVYTFACQTCQATKKDRAISATNKSCFKCRMKKSDEENDLTGRHFGDDENDGWTVICFAGRNKQYCGQRMWLCRCVCGIEKLVSAANLVSGKSKRCHSCGQKLWRKKKCERLEREVTNAVIIPS